MNDPLLLTLGAKVSTQPKPASNPLPLDIDLTVKWVGDILDDNVQSSDMQHPAALRDMYSDKLEEQLFGARTVFVCDADSARMRAALDLMPVLRVGVDLGRAGGDFPSIAKAWVDREGNYHVEPVAPSKWLKGDFEDVKTATGLQMLMEAGNAEIARIGRELAQASNAVRGDPIPMCDCEACFVKRHPLWVKACGQP